MLLKVDRLPNAVGKQPSIPLIYLGRKWTLNRWWWWWCTSRAKLLFTAMYQQCSELLLLGTNRCNENKKVKSVWIVRIIRTHDQGEVQLTNGLRKVWHTDVVKCMTMSYNGLHWKTSVWIWNTDMVAKLQIQLRLKSGKWRLRILKVWRGQN